MKLPILGRSFQGFDNRIWILFYGRIMTATGFSMAIPFLSLYLYNTVGISMSIIGLILLVSSLIGSMGQIIGGEIADRFGRKRIMSLALAWRAIAFIGVAAAIATGQHYLVIAALITVASFGGSLFEPASNAMVADVVEPAKRLEAYSFLRIAQNIGWATGPMIGGVLSLWLPFSMLYLLAAMATLVVAAFLFMNITESWTPGTNKERFKLRGLGQVAKDRQFMFYCLVSIALFIMFGQMSSTYAVYSTERLGLSQAEVGYLWTWNGILVVLIQIPVAHWISRYRSSSSLASGSLMYALGWGMVGLAGAWALNAPYVFLFLLINMTIVTMGEIVVSPASMNLVATMSPDNERGRYMGVYGLVSSIGFAAGPFAGGLILDAFWHQDVLLWALIGAFGIIAAVGFISLGHRLSSKTNSATGEG